MYEQHHEPLLSRSEFLRRIARHAAVAAALVAVSLVGGMWGYHAFEGLSWIDSFLNAAMLLGGMGPVNVPRTDGGKLFAGAYALYAGLVFLAAFAVFMIPLLHRFLHNFHLVTEQLEDEEEEQDDDGPRAPA